MRPTAWLVETALDLFDVEALPPDRPLRTLDNVPTTPHVGFVTRNAYATFYQDTVETIAAWHDGRLPRVSETFRVEIGSACRHLEHSSPGRVFMSSNTVIHRLVRPAVRLAARTGLTPNQVTTMRLVTGLAAAACFAAGTQTWMAIGALIFLLSMLFDRADGELARQINRMSPFGHRYDLVCDTIASTVAFFGLGIGLAPSNGPSSLWLGALAGLCIGAIYAELNVLKFASVRGYDLWPGVTVDPDDAMVLVPILVWCGLAMPMVIAAAVITPLAALALAAIGLRHRRVRT